MIHCNSKYYTFGRFLVWIPSDAVGGDLVLVPRNAIVHKDAVLKDSRRPRTKPRAFRLRRKWTYVFAFDDESIIDQTNAAAAMQGLDLCEEAVP